MKFLPKDNLIYKHFGGNLWLYIFSTICLCTGIVFGVYAVKFMDSSQKNSLLSYVLSFTKINNLDNNQIFIQSLKNNVPTLIVVWLLGLTMIGLPIILILDIIKGFSIGFTVTFFINGMGFKGMCISLLSVLPQNIVYIPCIITASVISMKFSIMLIKNYGQKQWTTNLAKNLLSYSLVFVAITMLMFIGFSFEAYVSPRVIKLVAFGLGCGFFEI